MKKEIYKDIEGYEGLYQVSNFGNVKSLGNGKTRRDKLLKPGKSTNGYLQVQLHKQGKRKQPLLHRLVAEAFIDNPQNLPQINHKDENKENNCVDNLNWCTAKYNINYGTHNQRSAASRINHPKRSKPVMCVETGVIYPSASEVQRQLGFAKQYISNTCDGRYKTAYGFHWKYVS